MRYVTHMCSGLPGLLPPAAEAGCEDLTGKKRELQNCAYVIYIKPAALFYNSTSRHYRMSAQAGPWR